MTKQKRLEASLYKGLRHMREVIYKALVVKDPSCRRFRNVASLQQPSLIVTDNRKGFNDPAVQEKSDESVRIAV